jgi:hypothetical protein
MIFFCVNPAQRARIAKEIMESEKPLRVEIDEALIQGAAQWLKNEGIFNGNPEALHVYVKRQILGTKAVTIGDEVFYLDAASRKMTKKQFKLFDEKLEPFLLNELNVPEEYLLSDGGNW